MKKLNYNECVKKGTMLYLNIENSKEELVKLTLEVCEIKNGGDCSKRYTVGQFAKDIGMNGKSLHKWVREYLKVTSKLGNVKRKFKDTAIIQRVMKKVKDDTDFDTVQRLYVEEAKRSFEDRMIIRYVEDLRRIVGFCQQYDLKQLNKSDVDNLKKLNIKLSSILGK